MAAIKEKNEREWMSDRELLDKTGIAISKIIDIFQELELPPTIIFGVLETVKDSVQVGIKNTVEMSEIRSAIEKLEESKKMPKKYISKKKCANCNDMIEGKQIAKQQFSYIG